MRSLCCICGNCVYLSATAAHARMASNGQSLTDEWVKNSEFKERKKKEDEDRNNKVGLQQQQQQCTTVVVL